MTYSNLKHQVKFTSSQAQRLKRWSIHLNVIFNNQTTQLPNSTLGSSVLYSMRVKIILAPILYVTKLFMNILVQWKSLFFIVQVFIFHSTDEHGLHSQELPGCQTWKPGHATRHGKQRWNSHSGMWAALSATAGKPEAVLQPLHVPVPAFLTIHGFSALTTSRVTWHLRLLSNRTHYLEFSLLTLQQQFATFFSSRHM